MAEMPPRTQRYEADDFRTRWGHSWRIAVILTCKKELGRWTVRINGKFVADFWREAPARALAMRIMDAFELPRGVL